MTENRTHSAYRVVPRPPGTRLTQNLGNIIAETNQVRVFIGGYHFTVPGIQYSLFQLSFFSFFVLVGLI